MAERAAQHPYLRPLVALGLLTVEYLIVTFVFDAYQLVEAGGELGGLGWMGLAGPAIIAFGTALWILAGREVREAVANTPPLDRAGLWPRLAVHLACFALFFVVTAMLFVGGPPPVGPPGAWIGLWFLTGAANAASLVPIAFGGRRLLALIQELRVPLALSTGLAVLALGAGLATLTWWDELNGVTLYSVAVLLDLLVSPIYFEPAKLTIGTPDFWVLVAPVCSGYEGIGLILVFLSAYLVAFRKSLRFPNVLVLIPVAILLVWVLNVVRIVALILVGHFWSSDIAIGGFHSKAGWLAFCGVALGAVWLTNRVSWFAADPIEKVRRAPNPSAPFLLPLLFVIATALVTGLFVDDFDYYYPLRVMVALLALGWYREEYLAGLRRHLGERPILSWHAVALGAAVYVLWIGVVWWTDPWETTGPPVALLHMSPPLMITWVLARSFGSIVTVPIIEELAFRGFLLRRIVASDFTKVRYDQWHWPAVLVSSLAFAAAHQQWIAGFAAGVAFAYAQKRRGLLSDAIIAHAVSNALITVHVLFGGAWALW
jgi:exosortase E/protease (VPEID-CTERM system)